MSDVEFLASFERCTLPTVQWTHRAHVRVAYLYASRLDLSWALEQMRASVKRYNKATNTPEAINRGYHETITQAFVRLVFVANEQTGPHRSSSDFCDAHPELLNKFALAKFYTRERLMTWAAKAQFVSPDIAPLPLTRYELAAMADSRLGFDARRFRLVESLTNTQIEQLHELMRQQWWGGARSLEDLRVMVENSSLMIGLVESGTDRLVGFSRVLTDFVFRATVYDVMVAEALQGQGLGTRLLSALCNHPKLQRVSFIYLACEPTLFSYYAQWGFKVYDGKAEWMIKVQREE